MEEVNDLKNDEVLFAKEEIGFSVIMPTYDQSHYIRRAIGSLLCQRYLNWELIIINDGCTDNTEEFVREYFNDERIKYIKNNKNEGLGYALNQGLDSVEKNYIAYLPSDDYYYEDHLLLLAEGFSISDDSILIHTKAKSEIIDSFANQYLKNQEKDGVFTEHGLQLVQCAHKKTSDRWLTRETLVTSNLAEMFWLKLFDKGTFSFLDEITCCWSIHPFQRHKLIEERYGGSIHKYKNVYHVEIPIRIDLGGGKVIDEVKLYENFRDVQKLGIGHLKILLVGDLSYNHDRIYAFEEHGHELYGLWASDVACWTNTGPLPFGHVTNIPYDNWRNRVEEIKPDVIYAQLNHGAVNLAHEVLKSNLGVPFVWHFKEGPSVCVKNGYWDKLIDLYHNADGKIFINREIKSWFGQFIPFGRNDLNYILDGDLAKSDYFTSDIRPKFSDTDGAVHTVVAGRMIGISIEMIKKLSESNIHIHAYSGNGFSFNEQAKKIAPDHFHVHPFCGPKDWTAEFSKYDAAWLHCIESKNNGNLMHANWDDLNLPCRINAYAAAALPIIQLENHGHVVAARNYIKERNVGLFFQDTEDLIQKLKDKQFMRGLSENMLRERLSFSFDYHVNSLIAFFKEVIVKKRNGHTDISSDLKVNINI